jgi:hypothetical protein
MFEHYLIFSPDFYYGVVAAMAVLAAIVFIVLLRVSAGYGMMYNRKWGPTVNNHLGWILMEAPVFFAMLLCWLLSPRRGEPALVVMTLLFEIHYFQRAFVFPLLLRGKSRMPLSIIVMGVVFNLVNAYMIGGWFFYVSPAGSYPPSWLWNPLFILGTVVFFAGMAINLHSDHIIRHLRRPGDTGHYIPRGGMFRFVTSANYFGELTEWIGFAILSWSLGGAVFALWTFANLAPRARQIHKRYISEFDDAYASLGRRYIIPFIY